MYEARGAVVALAALDAVAWASVEHVYGPADDVPALVRAVADPDESEEAVDELSMRIFHVGGAVCSAAPAVLPFLVALAADPGVVARVELLQLIGDLARDARTAAPEHVDAAWPAAWAQARPALLELLADPDVAVRRKVGYPLAQVIDGAEQVWLAVRRRWDVEDDLPVRCGLVGTVGQLLRNTDAWAHVEPHAWLVAHAAEPPGAVPSAGDPVAASTLRLQAVIALHRGETARPDPAFTGRVLAALRVADLRLCGQAWCCPSSPVGMISVIDRELDEDLDSRTRLVAELLEHPDPDYRAGALRVAAQVSSQWRTATDAMVLLVGPRLADPQPDNRAFAAALLAACGTRASAWADRLAEATADRHLPAADFATFALTRQGDPRCLPPLIDRLTGPRLGFPLASQHGAGWWLQAPGIPDVLAGVPQFATDLLPAVRHRLRAATTEGDRCACAQILTAWGPASAPAYPDLVDLLDTSAAVWALEALAAIGLVPDRPLPMDRIRALVADGRLPAWAQASAGRAYWRLTGDPQPALDVLLPQLGVRSSETVALEFLAAMGPAARRYADRVRAVLCDRDHSGLNHAAAIAWWRITGDPTEALGPLLDVVGSLAAGRWFGYATLRAIDTLGEIGPPAVEAVGPLERVLAGDRRPVSPGEWDSIRWDERFQQAATTALRRITGG